MVIVFFVHFSVVNHSIFGTIESTVLTESQQYHSSQNKRYETLLPTNK